MAAYELRPGEEAIPITGQAAAIVRNMEASLGIPTATSARVIPVNVMEENRRILNRHQEVMGRGKISLTHLVAWAIVRALETHPGLNDAYGEVDGRPMRIRKRAVNLGIAVDVPREAGTHGLLVPNIKAAEGLDFGAFLGAFDNLVGKARHGTLEPDAFFGNSDHPHQPRVLGHHRIDPTADEGPGRHHRHGGHGASGGIVGHARCLPGGPGDGSCDECIFHL